MALIKFAAAALVVLVCLFVLGDAEVGCIKREREALLSFKDGLIDEYGILSSWQSDDCCKWYGVECSNTTGHVVSLELNANYFYGVLQGKVGSSLLELHHLSYLDLSVNDFGRSPIPEFVGSMRELRHLYLSASNFAGIVPPHLGNLTNLLSLDLSYNSLRTRNLHWLSTLSLLSFLDLTWIDLSHTNWLHHIQSLPSLHELHLKSCNLSTDVDKTSKGLYVNSSHASLSILDLSINHLTYSSFDWLSNISTRIEHLDLSSNKLEGEIPISLWNLSHLSYLDLSENDFGGSPIPEFIGSMRELRHLYLGDSNFSGVVPPQLGNLTNLLSLDLSYNSLRTQNLHWLTTSLSKLSFLDLSGFDLSHTNWLHHIQSLPSLYELHLKSCNLSTDIDKPSKGLYVNSSHASLSILDLSINHLTYSSLDWLSNISTRIEHLDLSSNKLEGEIPKSLWNLGHLRVLVLYDNSLIRGEVFDEVFGNQSISGKGILESLQILELADNQLNGSVPDLRAFSGLTEVYLGGNKFTGSMPLSLGQLSNLTILDLSRNSLEGLVTESHFTKLHSLKMLDLFSNSGLKWNVSPDWSPPFQLDIIYIGGCNVGPSFPKWIQTQTSFRYVDLSSAGITDEAPRWLWSISPALRHLSLSHNQISGTIPNLSSTVIKDLDLSYNNFSGPIPLFNARANGIMLNGNRLSGSISSLCKIPHIELFMIDLSDNELGGEVPDCWDNMPNVNYLYLANNNFRGEFPPSFASLHSLSALQLRDNNFSGELPSTLRHCQHLQLADFGGNELTGEIPAWIGQIYQLVYLNLGRNNLHGSIPLQICNLSSICILDLSVNDLSGKIPDCFTNFTRLAQKGIPDTSYLGYEYTLTNNEGLPNVIYHKIFAYSSFQWKGQESEYRKNLRLLKLIDLSSNRLSGSIPQSFSSMRGLISLNLSRNSLTGHIIPDIGKMEMLECLDLSQNKLSGKIPASAAKLQFLAVLDLTNNSLSGKIPPSTQLQSFNASAYAGNSGLCGAPLPSCPPEDSNDADPPGKNTKHDENEIFSFVQEVCISLAFGFIVGFWGVVASFILKKSWRIAFFNSVDAAGDWLYVRTTLLLSKWRSTS